MSWKISKNNRLLAGLAMGGFLFCSFFLQACIWDFGNGGSQPGKSGDEHPEDQETAVVSNYQSIVFDNGSAVSESSRFKTFVTTSALAGGLPQGKVFRMKGLETPLTKVMTSMNEGGAP